MAEFETIVSVIEEGFQLQNVSNEREAESQLI